MDYKFFCFHGVPEYMQYDAGRHRGTQRRSFYDMQGNPMPFKDDPNLPNIPGPFPLSGKTFGEMQAMAADLSEGFQFVRIDLYEAGGEVRFGEMTFFDGGAAQSSSLMNGTSSFLRIGM